ncbi:MAG: thioredoxin family protein [Pirellulales bacterium]|nr:thioredoxin family protein [Pirellulales bacterium]
MTNLILVVLLQVSAVGVEQGAFEQAYRESARTGQPLVVLIGATWCPGCQRMKNSILPQVAKVGGLDGVVFFYVDFDQQRQLAMKLKRASSIPQLIRFNRAATGWEVTCLVGAKSPQEVYNFINDGLLKKTKTSEVSMTRRPEGQSRQPALAQAPASPKVTSQSPRATAVDASRPPKSKACPNVAKTVDGPSEWRPLYYKPLQETEGEAENTARQNHQMKKRR